jgi:hypothetical protein
MKRYAIMDGHGWPYGETERANGPWVRFEDAAAEIHRLNNLLTQVTLERDALKRTLNTIATMPDEGNEWEAVDLYATARTRAAEALP